MNNTNLKLIMAFFIILTLILFNYNSVAFKNNLIDENEIPIHHALNLYLSGSSENGVLSPYIPEGTENTASFPARAGTIFITRVGSWETISLKNPIIIAFIDVSIWVRGSGLQFNTAFTIYPLINGQRIGESIETNSNTLSSEPKEFTGSSSVGVPTLNSGDVFGIEIYVSERGSGGEIVYDSEQYPTFITIHEYQGSSMAIAEISEPEGYGEKVRITTNIDSLFGTDYINNYTLMLEGPLDEGTLQEYEYYKDFISMEEEDISSEVITVTWLLDSKNNNIKDGAYLIWVEMNIGDSEIWSNWTHKNITIIESKNESQLNSNIIFLIPILIIIALVIVIVLKKKRRS